MSSIIFTLVGLDGEVVPFTSFKIEAVAPDGVYLDEGVAVRNIAATTTAKKGFYLDEFQFKLTLPSARTGFVFT